MIKIGDGGVGLSIEMRRGNNVEGKVEKGKEGRRKRKKEIDRLGRAKTRMSVRKKIRKMVWEWGRKG